MGSARRYNTSIHIVEKAEVTRDGDRISGVLRFLVTPRAGAVRVGWQSVRFDGLRLKLKYEGVDGR